jgi:hypothetical protein
MRRTTVIVAALALLVSACGGQDPIEDLEPAAPGEEEPATPDDDAAEDDAAEDDGGATTTDDGGTTDDAAPEADPSAVADPCAGHEDRTDEAFIELVAPVDEQRVDDEVRIVGCSNVYEANISYRLLDGDGRTLEEGFTTAECGTGCVGAFDETVSLAVAEGEPVVYLQVFWGSPEDGSDRDLVERIVVLQ